MKTQKTQVHNLIILDKSGSMYSIAREAIGGYNETIGAIRAAQRKYADTQEHYISLAAFCSCGVEMLYDCVPIDQAKELTDKEYSPCCGTPLFDAIGKTVTALGKKTDKMEDVAVLVTIITDGMENDSREWNAPTIKKLIEDRKKEGWMFSYIGADHDVESVAMSISITNTVIWEKSAEGTSEVMRNENEARDRFYNKMSICEAPSMSIKEKRQMRKRFSEEFYDKDKI